MDTVAPTVRQSQTEDGSAELKGGLFEASVSTPEQPIAPGGVTDAVIKVSNHAAFINPLDPDSCHTQNFAGYGYIVDITPFWDDAQRIESCVTMAEDVEEHRTDFTMPETPGNYTIGFRFLLPGSEESQRIERTIVVEEGADNRPDPPENGDDEEDEGPLEALLDLLGFSGGASDLSIAAGSAITVLLAIIIFDR